MKADSATFWTLTALAHERDICLSDFLAHLSKLVPLFVRKQVRHKVVDVPGKRTINYYHQVGLIDPAPHTGREARYAYRHILQVLVVKLLQTENLTLKKIAEVTKTSRNEALEEVLLRGRSPFGDAMHSGGLTPLVPALPERRAGMAVYSVPQRDSLWRKINIAEGLELHVEDSFDLAGSLEFVSETVLETLTRMSREGRDRHRGIEGSPSAMGRESRAIPWTRMRSGTVIALVTEGGLVPAGNPDRLESARAGRFLRYSIADMNELPAGRFESIDRGWDNRYVNEDPNRLLPVDVLTELKEDETFSKIHDYFYTTTGVGTTLDDSRRLGESIAQELRNQQVSAVILTST